MLNRNVSKYINKNYNLISSTSKWIYYELLDHNYDDSKLIEALYREDRDITIMI